MALRRPARCVDGLDLHVDEGEIVSVIGPNGAGKTTLFNLDHRASTEPDERRHPASTGESIVGLEPHQITARGIARTFQTLRLFLNMTVQENVMAAAYGAHEGGRLPLDAAHAGHAARGAGDPRRSPRSGSSFFGERLMGYRWDQPAYSLSYANRRRLEIARATATNPRLLLLDEPAAGMNPVETHEITELIARAARRGRLHDPRDRARHARRRGHLRPRRRARPRRQDRRGHVRAGRDRPDASSRPTSAEGDGDEVSAERRQPLLELEGVNTYYGQIHILQDAATSRSARASSSACSAATPRASRRR